MPSKALSSEHIVDSSDEAESDHDERDKSRKRKSDARPRKDEKPTKRQKLTTPPENRNEKEVRDEEDEEDSVSDDDKGERSSSEESEDSSSSGDETSATASASTPQPDSSTSKSQPPTKKTTTSKRKSWAPPAGFEIVPEVTQDTNRVAGLFSENYLEGKKLWHITAPASVPINALSEVVLDHFLSDKTALSYGGTEYTLVMETNKPDEPIFPLIPNKGCALYNAGTSKGIASRKISRLKTCRH